MPNNKILVVEDSKTISMVFSLKLKAAGFEVTAAFNGYEALEKIKNDDFDLVLLDLIMPRMNGFAVLEELKKQNFSKPVIVTSDLSQEEDQKRAKELGAKKLFTKTNNSLTTIIDYIKETLKV